MKTLTKKKYKKTELKTQVFSIEQDTNDTKVNGVWVYKEGNLDNWVFKRYNTMAEAVRKALTIAGAIVLYNGYSVLFDKLNNNEAYYIDRETRKAYIVAL